MYLCIIGCSYANIFFAAHIILHRNGAKVHFGELFTIFMHSGLVIDPVTGSPKEIQVTDFIQIISLFMPILKYQCIAQCVNVISNVKLSFTYFLKNRYTYKIE